MKARHGNLKLLTLLAVLALSFTGLQHYQTCYVQRNSLVHTRRAYSNQPVRFVYLCGYKFKNFCQAVFPEYLCSAEVTSSGQEEDILLVGMHASCESAKSFKGMVVYVNGEPDRDVQVRDGFYLGPVKSEATETPMSKQFFFVQLAVIAIPQALPSFTRRPRNAHTGFLLYISRRCLMHREKAFNLFSRLAPVTAGGKCRGDTVENSKQGDITSIEAHGSWQEAHRFYQRFKFGLVMENTKTEGYVSEKILNAFIGGTVPIYYGTEDVFKIFNRKAFVFYDADNPAATVEEVTRLLSDEAAYEEIISQPILASGALDKYFAFYPQGPTVVELRKFLRLGNPFEGDD